LTKNGLRRSIAPEAIFHVFNRILIQKNKTLRYNVSNDTNKEKRNLMYKNYNMNQITLPLDLEVIIPEDDISLAVNALVESIPESEFALFDHTLGASSYHPRMMMKVILCSYTQSVTSGRQ